MGCIPPHSSSLGTVRPVQEAGEAANLHQFSQLQHFSLIVAGHFLPAQLRTVFNSTPIPVPVIPVYSHCEHHLAPFFGTASVGYTPRGRIVGLSKLTRLVECFSKRLPVQERLTIQIANLRRG